MLIPETTNDRPNKCCIEENLEFFGGGNNEEWETWECKECNNLYVVPIEIQRYFKDIELIKKQEV